VSGLGVGLIGLLGLFVGGVIWVVSWARATERPLLHGPICANPECAARLSPVAWLPLLGFGLARSCPVCGAAQPVRRIAFEIAVALYFMLAALRLGDDPQRLVATLVFAIPILIVLLVDAWTRYIYTDVILVGLAAALLYAGLEAVIAGSLAPVLSSLVAAVAALLIFGFFFVLAAVLYRNVKVVPFGLGDVYLAAMIGTMVGFPAVFQALFAGILIAGVAAVGLLLSRRADRRQAIAYGPYLCAGALLTLLFPPA
jgi:leader peptidase (prepilin peptidase)/N-methyltransferase